MQLLELLSSPNENRYAFCSVVGTGAHKWIPATPPGSSQHVLNLKCMLQSHQLAIKGYMRLRDLTKKSPEHATSGFSIQKDTRFALHFRVHPSPSAFARLLLGSQNICPLLHQGSCQSSGAARRVSELPVGLTCGTAGQAPAGRRVQLSHWTAAAWIYQAALYRKPSRLPVLWQHKDVFTN